MPEPSRPIGTLIADFTVDELAGLLGKTVGPFSVAPFGQVAQTLLAETTDTASDVAVVWTLPTSAISSFERLVSFEPVDLDVVLAEVDGFAALVARAATRYAAILVPTWTWPSWHRGLGILDGSARGIHRALTAMNLRLMERLDDVPNVHVLPAQRWMEMAGAQAHHPKLWYLGKVPFHASVFRAAAEDLAAAVRALRGLRKKLVVVDLDDTLWGGVVGDVGWGGLKLGGHNPLGEAFVDFQRGLRALRRRGVLLAIVSKNEESVALEALRSHPEMLLREDDFVGWRIDWKDKAANIASLVLDLNLGLSSVVFLDDNPVERDRVRAALPDVMVPDLPEDKLQYAKTLASLDVFDAPSVTTEDAQRTTLYADARRRDEAQALATSVEEWLANLGTVVRYEPLDAKNVVRAAQLLNKTNQMNLRTRRLTEAELAAWASRDEHASWVFHVRDKFGDAGLTGLLSVAFSEEATEIVDFVLSCRVMGRQIERAMLHVASAAAEARGSASLTAQHLPTAKNAPCLSFFEGSGLTALEAHRFVWRLEHPVDAPSSITLEGPPPRQGSPTASPDHRLRGPELTR